MICWSRLSHRWAVALHGSEWRRALDFVGPCAELLEEGMVHVVDFEMTHRCRQSCRYCYLGNNRILAEMDKKSALGSLEKLYDSGMRVLTLTGGEPLLRRDLLDEIVKRFNGRLLLCLNSGDPSIQWDDVLRLFDIVRVSCDDLTGSDTVRNIDSSSIVEFLENRPKGVEVVVNTVVTQENLANLEAHGRRAADIGVPVAYLTLESVGFGAQAGRPCSLPDLESYENNFLGSGHLGCLANRKCITMLPDGSFLRCILNRSDVYEQIPMERLRPCGIHVLLESGPPR